MLRNKSFSKYAVPLIFVMFLLFACQATLTTGQLNVITPFMSETYGWTESAITLPITIGGFAMIPGYFLVGWLLNKRGSRLVTCVGGALCATGGLLVALCGGNYFIYCIGMFMLYIFSVPLQLAAMKICSDWFISYRGRALGIATIGAPFAAAFLLTPLSNILENYGIQGGYLIVAGILLAITIICICVVRNSPSDVGLYPDGKDTPPVNENESETISIKELLSQLVAWKYIIASGLMNFIINASAAYMVMRFINVGGTSADGLRAMTIGALLGIPMSYVFGWIDDKLGSIRAMTILAIAYLIHLIPLTIMNQPTMAIIITAAFGMACMTGGLPTLDPSVVSYIWGRKKYQSANTTLLTVKGVIVAFAVYYMAAFSTAGHLTAAFVGLCVMAVISIIIYLTMWNLRDADLADRDYGKNVNAK